MQLKIKLTLGLCGLLLGAPSMLSASTGPTTATTQTQLSTPYAFLQGGLNVDNAQICQTTLKTCVDPRNGPLPDENCVKTKIKQAHPCEQLQQLADKLNTSPSLLTAKSAPNDFAVVQKNYPADGEVQNYIISPKGILVDTLMDPRLYSTVIKMQYPHNDLLVSNVSAVQGKVTFDKKTAFTTTIKISDGCKACKILGYATTRFTFKQNGDLQSVRLLSLSKNQNAA